MRIDDVPGGSSFTARKPRQAF